LEQSLTYNVIKKEGTSEIVVTKSRFIGLLVSVQDAAGAEAVIAGIRKKYHDARHNCWAYVILEDGKYVSRSSDDGEPSGTAGRPILTVMEGAGLVNALCIVTRYFGGVLLGTGGLVRAYTDSAKASLEDADISPIKPGIIIKLSFDYPDEPVIRRRAESQGFFVTGTDYGEKVNFVLTGPRNEADSFCEGITDITGGKVTPEKGEEIYY